MRKEVKANERSWNLLAKDHYETFKKRLSENNQILNPLIIQELGDIKGKTLMHLQCNTGADTLSLARLGAKVFGVDLAPDNIVYAQKLFSDFSTEGQFYTADLMSFGEHHDQQYDVVFTSEGAIIWLPDFKIWAQTIRKLLKDDGFVYINDMHPFFLMLDENQLSNGIFAYKYPYFNRQMDKEETIGGYAAKERPGECYAWMYSMSDIINALIDAGLQIEYIHEFDDLCYDLGNMTKLPSGQYYYPAWKGKIPFMFSIKATIKK